MIINETLMDIWVAATTQALFGIGPRHFATLKRTTNGNYLIGKNLISSMTANHLYHNHYFLCHLKSANSHLSPSNNVVLPATQNCNLQKGKEYLWLQTADKMLLSRAAMLKILKQQLLILEKTLFTILNPTNATSSISKHDGTFKMTAIFLRFTHLCCWKSLGLGDCFCIW